MSKKSKTNKRLREGDNVVVTAGNDRGRKGKILSRKGNDRFLVEGINVRKKAVRPTQENPQGRWIDIEVSIHGSNLMLAVEGDKGARLRARTGADGQKELWYRSAGNEQTYRSLKNKAK